MTKPTNWVCTQRRLRSAWASAQSDQSSLCAQWVAKDQRFLHADSEDTDQTGRMPRLIWVFAGCTLILLALSCRGSFINTSNYNYETGSTVMILSFGQAGLGKQCRYAQIRLLLEEPKGHSWAYSIARHLSSINIFKRHLLWSRFLPNFTYGIYR